METFEKQPYEEFNVGADFTADLAASETIVLANSAVSAREEADDTDVTSSLVGSKSLTTNPDNTEAQTDATLQALIGNGVKDKEYILTFRIETSLNQKFEHDVRMSVREN